MKQQEYIAVRANGRYSIPALGDALQYITDRGGSVIELMQAMVTMADAAAYYKAAHDAETDDGRLHEDLAFLIRLREQLLDAMDDYTFMTGDDDDNDDTGGEAGDGKA